MYKSFVIFLLFCFCGAGAYCMEGEMNTKLDEHHVLAMMDVDTEDENSLDNLLNNLLEPGGDNHTFPSTLAPNNVNIFSRAGFGFAYLISDNYHRGAQRPLFLLFHSFLFYELTFKHL